MNVEAEIYQNFKNMLRTYPRLWVGERFYFPPPISFNLLFNEQHK